MKNWIITVLLSLTILATAAFPVHAAPVDGMSPELAKEYCGTSAKLAYTIIYYKHLGGTEAELRSYIKSIGDTLGVYKGVVTDLITVYYGKQFDNADFSPLFEKGVKAKFVKQFTDQCSVQVLGVET